jgi:hypothetical protein
MKICPHPDCTTCRSIVVGMIAQQLRSIAEGLRAGICVEALRLAKRSDERTPTREAVVVEAMIG